MTRPALLFVACILAATAGALALRLPRLDQRPMHGDEANQAVRAGILLDTGVYRYDPVEHHGPTLYWITLPLLRLSGAADFAQTSEFAYRLVPVLFGTGLIVLLLLAADGLGRGPAVLAAVLTAISPAMVYYSRYYIQETLLVFFTFAAIVCAWRYARGRSLGWAAAAGVSLGLMHATKETWVLAAGAMAAGLLLTAAWTRWRDGAAIDFGRCLRPAPILAAVGAAVVVAGLLYSSFGTNWRGPLDSILAYGTYWRRAHDPGLHSHGWHYYLGLLLANRPMRGFFWTEGMIVGLAVVGMARTVLARRAVPAGTPEALSRLGGRAHPSHASAPGKAHAHAQQIPVPLVASVPASRDRTELVRQGAAGVFQHVPSGRPPGPPPAASADTSGQSSTHESSGNPGPSLGLCRFLAFYTITLTILYSAISYKTPWCLLGFLHGMILLAGVGAWAVLRSLPGVSWRAVVGLLLLIGVLHLGRQSYALNYRFYADQRNPYVYAHTSSDILNLAAQMERLAQASPEGHDMVIHVVTPENCWPLPWYLRRFNTDRVGYWQDEGAWSTDAERCPPPSVIITTEDVRPLVEAKLRAAYNSQITCGLRPGARGVPGVLLVVHVRDDLWRAFLARSASGP